MELLAEIKKAWGWVGVNPEQVVGDNEFGNLIVKDVNGSYWRLCPEDLYCKTFARNRDELDALSTSQEFLRDWHMQGLVAQAKEKFGLLKPGYKYCLKIPGPLGGEYGGQNLATIPLVELVSVSGHVAREIEGLPDGAQVKLKILSSSPNKSLKPTTALGAASQFSASCGSLRAAHFGGRLSSALCVLRRECSEY